MQNITAARLLPGFLGPAAGEWCAPLSLVQVLGLLSWSRLVVAMLGFALLELGRAEVRKFRLWALLPLVREGDSVKTRQRASVTGEMRSVRVSEVAVPQRQEPEVRRNPFAFKRSYASDILTGTMIQERSEGEIFAAMLMTWIEGLRWGIQHSCGFKRVQISPCSLYMFDGLKSEMQHPTWIATSMDCGVSLLSDTLRQVSEAQLSPVQSRAASL